MFRFILFFIFVVFNRSRNRKQAPGFVDVPNDRTNTCAFLAIKIANKIIKVVDQKIPSNGFSQIAEVEKQIICFFPQEINDFRNKDQTYDVLSAYNIMSRAKCLVTPYELSEELVGGDGSMILSKIRKLFQFHLKREKISTLQQCQKPKKCS